MRIKHMIAALLCIVSLCGCAKNAETEEYSKVVFAMDTEMSVKAFGDKAEVAVDAAELEINRLDKLFRRGSEQSEVYKINNSGSADVSEDTASLTERALEICDQTGGLFDISIAPVMDIWGFYTKEYHVPSEAELAEAMADVDYRNISVKGDTVSVSKGAMMDLGGIAKGYLSSKIMDIFKENGVSSGIVSLGGNVQTLGAKPDGSAWRVAIQSPVDENKYIGSVSIKDMAVVTSGGYQRFFEDNGMVYHHIIDPRTGYPADSGVSSVTIVSADGTLADGLSTSLFVMGLDAGTQYWRTHDGFDVIFVTDDGGVYITEGLEDIFESQDRFEIIKR